MVKDWVNLKVLKLVSAPKNCGLFTFRISFMESDFWWQRYFMSVFKRSIFLCRKIFESYMVVVGRSFCLLLPYPGWFFFFFFFPFVSGPWAFWKACNFHFFFFHLVVLNDTMWIFMVPAALKCVPWNFSWIKNVPWCEGWNWRNGRTQGWIYICCS